MVPTRFRDPQALSSALATLGTLQPRAFGSLNRVETLDSASNYYQEYIIGREGRVSYSIYYCANVLRIIKFEWLTQTNCETHQYW